MTEPAISPQEPSVFLTGIHDAVCRLHGRRIRDLHTFYLRALNEARAAGGKQQPPRWITSALLGLERKTSLEPHKLDNTRFGEDDAWFLYSGRHSREIHPRVKNLRESLHKHEDGSSIAEEAELINATRALIMAKSCLSRGSTRIIERYTPELAHRISDRMMHQLESADPRVIEDLLDALHSYASADQSTRERLVKEDGGVAMRLFHHAIETKL